MSETGTAFSTTERSGLIAVRRSEPVVRYDAAAIAAGGGPAPQENERVVFERAPGTDRATSVRVASSADAELTLALRNAFEARLDASRLSDATRAEVVRLAADRAVRAKRRTGRGQMNPDVLEARIALATAAMALLAVEAGANAPEELTASDLRRVLRRQRPALPR